MAECLSCGADNPEGAPFCGLCASPFAAQAETAPPRSEKEKWSTLEQLKPVSRGRRGRGWIWGISFVAVVVIAILAVVLVRSHVEKAAEGQAQFTSKYSALSFKYPSSWEKRDVNYLKTLNKGQAIDPRMGNEVVLMKRGSSLYRHLLVVSSAESPFGEEKWDQIKQTLQTDAQQGGPENRTDITYINLGLQASTRANGIGTLYTVVPPMGPSLFQIEALILRDNIMYTFALTTPLKGGGSDEGEARTLFIELMQNITFK